MRREDREGCLVVCGFLRERTDHSKIQTVSVWLCPRSSVPNSDQALLIQIDIHPYCCSPWPATQVSLELSVVILILTVCFRTWIPPTFTWLQTPVPCQGTWSDDVVLHLLPSSVSSLELVQVVHSLIPITEKTE